MIYSYIKKTGFSFPQKCFIREVLPLASGSYKCFMSIPHNNYFIASTKWVNKNQLFILKAMHPNINSLSENADFPGILLLAVQTDLVSTQLKIDDKS